MIPYQLLLLLAIAILKAATIMINVNNIKLEKLMLGEKRPLSHQGISYEDDWKVLGQKLDKWINATKVPEDKRQLKAVIVSHASPTCCRRVTASAFARLRADSIKTMILIGTSHHFVYQPPMLTMYGYLETPFGDLPVDTKINKRLISTYRWNYAHKNLDQLEHSIENILPFVGRIFNGSMVPIVTGDMTRTRIKQVAADLAEYMTLDDTLFVISTDMCHWGEEYEFTEGRGIRSPEETVRLIDLKTLRMIATLDPERFLNHTRDTDSNICGEIPIALLLYTMANVTWYDSRPSLELIRYRVGKLSNDSYVGCLAAGFFMTSKR